MSASADIRAVIDQIVADFTAYPLAVELKNRSTVDQATQASPYLLAIIDYLPGGGQLDLGDRPFVKQVGQLSLHAVVRAGAGTADAEDLLDFVIPYFELKTCGAITFHEAVRTRGAEIKGWWHEPVLFDFWYTRLSA